MSKSNLYKGLRDAAKAKMPYLVYVDLQKMQFEREDENYPIPLPALLIEFTGTNWSNLLKHAQIGEMTIRISLYLPIVTDSFDDAELENETLEILDREEDLFTTFEGLSISEHSQMIRVKEYDADYGLRYVCFSADFSVVKKEQIASETSNISRPQTIRIVVNDN